MIGLLFTLLQGASAAEGQYEIGAGDVVTITVHRTKFAVSKFEVSESGEISFPYVGRIKLAGLDTFEAEEHIINLLKDGYLVNPEVTVQVDAFNHHKVQVIGDVGKSGEYPLKGTTTVRDVLTKAGRAKSGTVIRIKRDDELVVEFGSSELDSAPGATEVKAGDIIVVTPDERVWVSGEVKDAGAVPFQRGLTASQAMFLSGGASKYARLAGAYIVRPGEDKRIRINMNKVLRGKHSDIVLKPGDRLIIPVSPL